MIEGGVIDLKGKNSKVSLVYGQMNEPPGARARVCLTGLTIAEYFRDQVSKYFDEETRLLKMRLPVAGGSRCASFHRQHFPLHASRLRGVGAARSYSVGCRLPAYTSDGYGLDGTFFYLLA